MKRVLKALVYTLLGVLILCGAAGYYVYSFFCVPTGMISEPVVLTIEKGDTLGETAHRLVDMGAVKDDRIFIALARSLGAEKKIRAGEYEIAPDMAPRDILLLLMAGRVVEYPVTIPEGYNIYQVSETLAEKGFGDESIYLALMDNQDFISSHGIDAETLEGYLFPDTYNMNRGMDERDILGLMIARYSAVFDEEKESSSLDVELSDYEILILASIIEKEAKDSDERALISAVFVNRLDMGMKLDSCATVIYGIWDRFDGNLRRSDLEEPSDYNTYIITGLPKTPICNPGRAAIRAALNPADVEYLYFVSKNDGTHYFSTTLSEHNRAVYKYQKLRDYR
ncbi:MAG: endolytic transglycosylase MltG [Deltaproteobacteria bacterium]|nr:endolytic transglycosylase MltG [Candidatus Zymogenaceae bacterium]